MSHFLCRNSKFKAIFRLRKEPRKGLKRYPFDAGGGKRYKRKARFFGALAQKNAPRIF
jgi:hypothetical protein